MDYTNANGIDLVTEMTVTDTYNENDIADIEALAIMEMVEELPEVDVNLFYTEEMVPVFRNGDEYLIEHENIMKCMLKHYEEGNVFDEDTIVEKICEVNSINLEESTVVIVTESEENYRKNIFFIGEKLKKEKDKKKKQFLRMRLAKYKDLLSKLKSKNKDKKKKIKVAKKKK